MSPTNLCVEQENVLTNVNFLSLGIFRKTWQTFENPLHFAAMLALYCDSLHAFAIRTYLSFAVHFGGFQRLEGASLATICSPWMGDNMRFQV